MLMSLMISISNTASHFKHIMDSTTDLIAKKDGPKAKDGKPFKGADLSKPLPTETVVRCCQIISWNISLMYDSPARQ